MTIFLVECSGGEYDDSWYCIEDCFASKELADECIRTKKNINKNVQSKKEEFNRMFDTFCEEISADGMPECGYYFDVYGASFEDFIKKIESYKERNSIIKDFFIKFNMEFIKQMYDWYITNDMRSATRSCNINYWVHPMHVSDKVEL